MRGSEVFRSLIGGCLVYALTLACSSGGGDGGSVDGSDTGGVTGMNGNGGSSGGQLGSGSVANAQTGGDSATGGDQGTGGDAVGCECPAAEPDVEVTVDCDANYQTQLWAELTIPGVKASDLGRIRYFSFDDGGDVLVGTPGQYASATSGVLAHKVDTVAAQCWGNKATFILPADLASALP